MTDGLIRELEEAEVGAGDWVLTNRILLRLGWTCVSRGIDPAMAADYGEAVEAFAMVSPAGKSYPLRAAPAVSEDLTAARALVPPDWDLELQYDCELIELEPEPGDGGFKRFKPGATRAACELGDPALGIDGEAATLELAICAAVLRAADRGGFEALGAGRTAPILKTPGDEETPS